MPIVIKKTDGRVALMTVLNGADPQSVLEQWQAANPGQYVRHVEVAQEDLPADRGHRDAWTLTDADAVQVDPALILVPQEVTRRQAKEALRRAGKLSLVQPAIDSIVDPDERAAMQIEWDESLAFQRNRPSLIAIGTAIGLDSAAIDDFFIQAAAL